MSLKQGEPVGKDILDVVRSIVQRIPPFELEIFASASPSFKGGGFRRGAAAPIRARIEQLVSGTEPIAEDLRKLLAKYHQASQVLSLLSDSTARLLLAPLAFTLGRPSLALALALDGRFKDIAMPADDDHESSVDDAKKVITAYLDPLLLQCSPEMWNEDGVARQVAPSEKPSRVKSLETKLEKEQNRVADLKERLDKEKGRAETAEKEISVLRRRASEAENERDYLRRHVDSLSAAAAEARLANEFAGWLGPDRAAILLEAARAVVATAPSPSIPGSAGFQPAGISDGGAVATPAALPPPLARLSAAMERQAAADPASASRHYLETLLASYERALASSSSLIADALSPLPELVAAHDELKSEVARIERLLRPPRQSQASGEIRLAIGREANASSVKDLPDLQHLVSRLLALGLLSKEDADAAGGLIRSRYAALYAKRGDPDEVMASSPEGLLRAALGGRSAAALLIDGHNALFALQSRYCRPQDHRGPSAEARDWLVSDIVQMVSGSPNCRVTIVFDGPERSEHSPSGNVKVIFSGGGSSEVEHRADDVIVDELKFLSKTGISLLLATNDNGLSSRAASLGARTVAPTALLEYFA